MADEIGESERAMLAHLNPRRFALLLRAAELDTFTAPQFKAAFPDLSSSLTRDLNALETAGLVLAEPPASEPRQGRQVAYQVAPDVPERFQRLGALVTRAWATRTSWRDE